jgi:hypothetical protein
VDPFQLIGEDMPEKYYSEKEAAEFINRKPGTLRTWRSTKEPNAPIYIKDTKGKVAYRESDLIAWMEGE